jgi:Purple acid Phosphatase, N-terminal domain
VTIRWSTNEPADSRVEYWVTGVSTHTSTPTDPALVTDHALVLSGLQARTKYSYRVTSADAAGTVATSDTSTFRTKR